MPHAISACIFHFLIEKNLFIIYKSSKIPVSFVRREAVTSGFLLLLLLFSGESTK